MYFAALLRGHISCAAMGKGGRSRVCEDREREEEKVEEVAGKEEAARGCVFRTMSGRHFSGNHDGAAKKEITFAGGR